MQSAAQQCAKRNKEKEKDKKGFKLTAKANHRIAEDTVH